MLRFFCLVKAAHCFYVNVPLVDLVGNSPTFMRFPACPINLNDKPKKFILTKIEEDVGFSNECNPLLAFSIFLVDSLRIELTHLRGDAYKTSCSNQPHTNP